MSTKYSPFTVLPPTKGRPLVSVASKLAAPRSSPFPPPPPAPGKPKGASLTHTTATPPAAQSQVAPEAALPPIDARVDRHDYEEDYPYRRGVDAARAWVRDGMGYPYIPRAAPEGLDIYSYVRGWIDQTHAEPYVPNAGARLAATVDSARLAHNADYRQGVEEASYQQARARGRNPPPPPRHTILDANRQDYDDGLRDQGGAPVVGTVVAAYGASGFKEQPPRLLSTAGSQVKSGGVRAAAQVIDDSQLIVNAHAHGYRVGVENYLWLHCPHRPVTNAAAGAPISQTSAVPPAGVLVTTVGDQGTVGQGMGGVLATVGSGTAGAPESKPPTTQVTGPPGTPLTTAQRRDNAYGLGAMMGFAAAARLGCAAALALARRLGVDTSPWDNAPASAMAPEDDGAYAQGLLAAHFACQHPRTALRYPMGDPDWNNRYMLGYHAGVVMGCDAIARVLAS